jgi:LacI family transcriptional regulator
MTRTQNHHRTTAQDVAARAGVSQPTVSLVLSRNPHARIAPETRARVLRAAEELGYRANLVARGLKGQRSYAIGLLVPDTRNPFFVDVMSGAERVATAEGYALLLSEQRAGSLDAQLETMRSRLIDGVIIDAVGAASLPADALADLNVVLIDEPPSERWPGVASDALGAGRLAADHLLGHGHRRVAFIGPATDVHATRMRERGFVQALRAAGAPIESPLFRRAQATVAGGRMAMRALLALRADQRPTAVFCGNDLLAVGALKECTTSGIDVPRQLSIVGCDDIELARLVTPELTTVAVPARELGARAARLLLATLEQKTARVSQARPLPVTLVARGSSGPVPSSTVGAA